MAVHSSILARKSHGQGSLEGPKESDTTEHTAEADMHSFTHSAGIYWLPTLYKTACMELHPAHRDTESWGGKTRHAHQV